MVKRQEIDQGLSILEKAVLGCPQMVMMKTKK